MSLDNITVAQIKALHAEEAKVKTIGSWKRIVKEFAIEHELTDMEAITVANDRIFK